MNINVRKIGALVLFGCVSVVTVHAERTWTNTDGEAIKATLVRVESGYAVLRMNGLNYRVPAAELSEADQAYLKDWEAEQASPTFGRFVEPEEAPSKPKVGKKGFGLSMASPNWREQLEALNANWYYDWTSGNLERINSKPRGIEYVPMITGNANHVFTSRARLSARKPTSPYILTYNEPDKAKQANRTVEEVLEEWPELMELDMPLVSPATVSPENEWMEAFMEGVESRGYRVDFIAVHNYGGGSPAHFLRMLDRVYEKYGRPIWITEFGVGDWSAKDPSENRHSPEHVLAFMKEVLPELDKRDHIYRYAWFNAGKSSAPLSTSALFNEDGTLTELGQFYADHN